MVDAKLIAKQVDGVVHPEAELIDLVWTPLDKARELDLPRITHMALDELSAAIAADSTGAAAHSIASFAASMCARSFRAGGADTGPALPTKLSRAVPDRGSAAVIICAVQLQLMAERETAFLPSADVAPCCRKR